MTNSRLLLAALLSVSGSWTTTRAEFVTRYELRGHNLVVTSAAFSPDGSSLATVSGGGVGGSGELRIWDVRSGAEIRRILAHQGHIRSVAWSPDGAHLATAGYDHTIRLFDAASGNELATLRGHTHWVNSVAFSPDSQSLASASRDGSVMIWDVQSRELARTLKDHPSWVMGVQFSPDGRWLASATANPANSRGSGEVRIYELTDELPMRIAELNSGAFSLAFHPTDDRLFVGTGHGEIQVLNVQTVEVDRAWSAHKQKTASVAVSRSGQLLVSGSSDRLAKLWDVQSGELMDVLEGHRDAVYGVATAMDGELIATTSRDRTVRVWQIDSGAAANFSQRIDNAAPQQRAPARKVERYSTRSFLLWLSVLGPGVLLFLALMFARRMRKPRDSPAGDKLANTSPSEPSTWAPRTLALTAAVLIHPLLLCFSFAVGFVFGRPSVNLGGSGSGGSQFLISGGLNACEEILLLYLFTVGIVPVIISLVVSLAIVRVALVRPLVYGRRSGFVYWCTLMLITAAIVYCAIYFVFTFLLR